MGCRYCKSDTDGDFCSDSCKNLYNEYTEFENRTKYWCLLGLIVGVVLAISAGFFNRLLAPIGILIIGLTMIAFPLMTEWDIKHWGVKKSKVVLRSIGVVIAVFAIAAMIVMLI